MPSKSSATTKARSTAAKAKSGKATPAGSYLVTCETIEEEWPDDVGEEGMILDIRETGQSGVYEASFDFGIAEGAMVLSSNKESLKSHVTRLDKHSGYEDADEDDEEEEEEEEGEGTEEEDAPRGKRKAAEAAKPRGRPANKTKATTTSAREVFLACRGCETGEGQIYSIPSNGTMSFDAKFASLSGTFGLGFIGDNVPFTGRKVSDTPRNSHLNKSWNDYSDTANESARAGRWN